MALEAEIKIPVNDLETVIKRLKQEGFQETEVCREEDTYFNSPYYDMKEKDKALRIRRSRNMQTGEEWAQLNCKGAKLDQISMARKELETEIREPEIIEGILKELGFEPLSIQVIKTRRTLYNGEITAAADRVEGLGEFLELEIIAERENQREECLEKISRVLRAIGYKMEQTVRTSYLSMLFGKRG